MNTTEIAATKKANDLYDAFSAFAFQNADALASHGLTCNEFVILAAAVKSNGACCTTAAEIKADGYTWTSAREIALTIDHPIKKVVATLGSLTAKGFIGNEGDGGGYRDQLFLTDHALDALIALGY